MTPVKQTVSGHRGNCMSACIATLLDMPLKDVPNFWDNAEFLATSLGISENEAWWKLCKGFLELKGYGLITIVPYDILEHGIAGNYIVSGEINDSSLVYHATIWKGDKLIFDPSPEDLGTLVPKQLDILYKIL